LPLLDRGCEVVKQKPRAAVGPRREPHFIACCKQLGLLIKKSRYFPLVGLRRPFEIEGGGSYCRWPATGKPRPGAARGGSLPTNFEKHRIRLILLEHYTECSTAALSGSLVTDIKGTSLADVKEFDMDHFESEGERVPCVDSAE
jgi:hypothetical protein